MTSQTRIDSLKTLIFGLLPGGYVTLKQAAQLLGISERTLQRHMRAAGTTYSQLIDEVRFELACRLLDDRENSISDVGRALGFTDSSNFSRAFLRWAGMSPTAYLRMPPGSAIRLSRRGAK